MDLRTGNPECIALGEALIPNVSAGARTPKLYETLEALKLSTIWVR